MMIRMLFMICMMIGLMMPCAWAQEKVDVPFEVPQNYQQTLDHVQNRTDSRSPIAGMFDYGPDYYYHRGHYLPIGSPLTKLHIETKDWCDGDTYYVQCTITNPTDELIEKDIDHIEIFYLLKSPQKNAIHWQAQHSDIISKLTLAPHSTYSFVIPLTIKESYDFIHYSRSTLYFTDRSDLEHRIDYNNSPLPDVLIAPIMLPSGEVYLAMKNHHPTKTVSDIREIYVNYHFRKNSPPAADPEYEEFNYTDASPLPLTLKPQETAFYRLPQSIDRSTRALPLAFVWLHATIDGTRHRFNLLDFNDGRIDYEANQYTQNVIKYRTPTIFDTYGLNLVEASGTYETDGTTLYGYLRIKNPHDKPLLPSDFVLYSMISYYRADNSLSRYVYNVYLPSSLTIAPKEEKLFSFTLPLPQDIAHTLRFTDLSLEAKYENKTYRLHYDVEFTHEKVAPSKKSLYIPAADFKLVEQL